MAVYMDTIVGHKLIVEKKGLGKKLSLKDVTYGGLLWELMTEMDEQGTLQSDPTLFQEIDFYIKQKIEENIIKNISFRNGGEGVGNSEIEKRISALQFDFTNAYLKKTLEYFQGML